jgi:excisionase family DNA binding protein
MGMADTVDLTVTQMATLLHVHRNTVLKLIHRGILTAYRVGTGPAAGYRFTPAMIQAFRDRGKDRPRW